MEEIFGTRKLSSQQLTTDVVYDLAEAFHNMTKTMQSMMSNWHTHWRNDKKPFQKHKRNCYNCGGHSHIGYNCPWKDRGTKCYNCNKFGHLSTSCSGSKAEEKKKCSPKARADFGFNQMSFAALISKLEQKFRSYSQHTKSLLVSFEEMSKEKCMLQATVENLHEECTKLRTINKGNISKIEVLTSLMASNSGEEDKSRRKKQRKRIVTMMKENPLQEKKAIYTFVRIKPSRNVKCFKLERSPSRDTLTLFSTDEISTKQYTCDYAFGPEEVNEGVFNKITPFLDLTMKGSNACIVTYGGSGTGKSHTMIGNAFEQGIILKAIDYIMTNGKQQYEGFNVQFSISEIYNETVIDLMRKYNQPEQNKGLRRTNIKSIADFLRHFEFVKKRRKTASTLRNPESSRSHFVLKLFLSGIWRRTKDQFKSNITMLDCAGYERSNDHLKDAKANIRTYEMIQINKTCSELAAVIENLQKEIVSIDLRSSRLLYTLKPFLGSDAKMLFLATISQESQCLAASMATLNVVDLANRIKINKGGGELQRVVPSFTPAEV